MKIQFIILSFIIILSFNNSSFCQTPYYDAIALKNLTAGNKFKNDETSLKQIAGILSNYFSGIPNTPISINALDIITANNPYINPFIHGLTPQSNNPFTLTTSLSAIEQYAGNWDITAPTDAIAQVMVAQFKEDITQILFVHFQNYIENENFKDLRILFPDTYRKMLQIGDQVYDYKKYINDIRIAFKQDLNKFLDNLPNEIENGSWSTLFNSDPNLKSLCLSSIYFGNSLIAKTAPGDILANYPDSLLNMFTNSNVKPSIKLIQLISNSFKSSDKSSYWITSTSIEKLSDKNTRNIYLGLLYQESSSINFTFKGTTVSFQSILDTIHSDEKKTNKISALLINLGKEMASVSENMNKLKPQIGNIDAFYSSVQDLIDSIGNLPSIPGLETLKTPKFKDYTSIAKDGCIIASDISKGEYFFALNSVVDIYQKSIGDNGNKQQNTISNFIQKYGDFMSYLVIAQNKDELKAAIQNAVQGSGGSVVKQKRRFSIAVNSYIGGLYSWTSTAKNKLDQPIQSAAFTAPIGLSFNFGLKKKCIGYLFRDFTFFGSLVDIGAVAAFRLNDDSTQSIPKTTLGNIISPGIHAFFGRIANSPITLGIGYQMAPHLRNLTATNADVVANNVWQLQVSLTWDIPFFYICKSKEELP